MIGSIIFRANFELEAVDKHAVISDQMMASTCIRRASLPPKMTSVVQLWWYLDFGSVGNTITNHDLKLQKKWRRERERQIINLEDKPSKIPSTKDHHLRQEQFYDADLELEQEDTSEDDELAELETLPEEDDVISEESKSEVHVTKAFLAGWRAKQKHAGSTGQGRGFQGHPSMPDQKGASVSGNVTVVPARIRVRRNVPLVVRSDTAGAISQEVTGQFSPRRPCLGISLFVG